MPREASTPREHEPLLQNGTHYCDVNATEEPRGASNGSDTGRCRDKAITVFGWCFDFVTVAISLVDVVFDILVALQFLRDGHTTWGWLVLGCLIVSNTVYSAIVASCKSESQYGAQSLPYTLRELSGPVVFCIVFPFGQLVPALNYIFQTFFVNDESRFGKWGAKLAESDVGFPLPASGGNVVVEDEQKAVRADVAMMCRLHSALENYQHTHGLFLIETVIESIPQSIIQLLAISVLGSPSTFQLLSLLSSLLSVVSKGYIMSVSCDIRIFVFKFLLVAHDVFSTFYVFCTILSREGPKEVELFPHTGFEVSWVAYIWFMKAFAMVGLALLCGLVLVVLFIVEHPQGCPLVVPLLVSPLGLVPIFIAAEATKLSWIITFWSWDEPYWHDLPDAAMTLSFLSARASRTCCHASDWKARLSFLHVLAYESLLERDEPGTRPYLVQRRLKQTRVLNHTGRLQMHLERTLLAAIRSSSNTRLQHRDEQINCHLMHHDEEILADPVLSPAEITGFDHCWEFESLTRDELFSLPENSEVVEKVQQLERELNDRANAGEITFGERGLRMRSQIIELIYDHSRLRHLCRRDKPLLDSTRVVSDGELFGVPKKFFYLGVGVEGLSVFLSFLFPFVNYWMYFDTQTFLQHVCFGLLAVSLVLMLPLLPAAFQYNRWVTQHAAIQYFLENGERWFNTQERVERLQDVIVAFHHPPQETLLRSTVDASLIPPDVSGLVAEFLPSSAGVNMEKLTTKECKQYREQYV